LTLSALALAGCSSSDSTESADPAPRAPTTPTSAGAPTTATTPTTTPSEVAEPTTPADLQELVERVAFKQSDLRGGGTVKLMPYGDQVVGFVTLDNCGFTFTTEAARTARRQVVITLDGKKDARYSNEVVTYPDEVTATRAIDEERQSVRDCDGSVFRPARVGGSYRYETLAFVEHAGQFPVDDAMSLTERVTAEDGTVFYGLAIFLHAGTVLDAHYFGSPHKPTRKQIATLAEQAMVTATRLADRSA
jgi:hypothetical protein